MLRSMTTLTKKCLPVTFKAPMCVQLSWRGRKGHIIQTEFPDVPEERKHISQFDDMDMTQLKPQYQHIKELENASENVHKVFSLEHGNILEIMEAKLQQYVAELQSDEYDYDSVELQIVQSTIWIRFHQENFARSERRGKRKQLYLQKLYKQRADLLMKLRSQRYERYSRVMRVLNLNLYFEPDYNVKLTERAQHAAEMKLRTFAEIKRRKDERERRVQELARVQEEFEEKLKSGMIAFPS